MPIEAMAKLAHAAGAELFVDAVQAAGAVPVTVGSVDYLAAGAHKWLMGLEGAGFLYVSPARIEALRPNTAGWLSHEDPVDFLLRGPDLLRYDKAIRRRADLFEGGNVNTAGLSGLEASVDLIQQLGVPAIFAHVNRILDAIEPALAERGFPSLRAQDPRQRSCTLSVRPPSGVGVVDLGREMAARGVACSTPDGLLRFSPHWPSDVGQAAVVLAAVDGALASLR
jgi:selenocysteine lyase/cysteine desulfurase